MHVERPDYLWLLAVLPLLWFCLRRYVFNGQTARRLIGRSTLVSGITPERREALVVAFVLAMAAFLALSLARPYVLRVVETPELQKMNIVFLLDVSPSMGARDIWPSRMERSKEVIRRFIQRETAALRFGLVSFSESSVILSYLTSDLQNIYFYLDFLTPDRNLIVGTDIGAAVSSGIDLLAKDEAAAPAEPSLRGSSVMILISDGEDHGEDLDKALADVRKRKTRIHAIGVGTSEGATMPIVNDAGETEYLKDERGMPMISRLSVETLQRVAQETGGSFFRAGSGGELDFAFQEIFEAENRILGYKVRAEKRELTRYFAGLAFFSHLVVMTLRI